MHFSGNIRRMLGMSAEQNMGAPLENSLKYDIICQVVGHLYLDSFHKSQNMELHAASMMEQLRIQNSTLIKEVAELEAQLKKHDGI